MIFNKIWVLWITLQTCFAVSKKKDLSALTSLRDTIEVATSENPGSVSSIKLSETQKQSVLQLHNAFRSMVKPTASNMLKMVWDPELEKIASTFASKCIVAHNPDRHKLAKNYDWVGENIAWGTGTCGDKDCGDVYEGVKRWFSESKSYNYLTGQCSGKCTLYTQMVWWESNKLGCGAKRCGDRTILVCNYAPGGNYVGQRPYKPGKVCSECPSGMGCEDNLCIEKKDESNDKMKASARFLDTTQPQMCPTPMNPNAPCPTVPPTPLCPTPSDPGALCTTVKPTPLCPTAGGVAQPCTTPSSVTLCPTGGPTPCPTFSPRRTTMSHILKGTHMLPAGWVELPVRLTQVDSGITSFIWGMDGHHSLSLINKNHQLVIVDGKMHHVSAGQSGVWAVGLLGNVFFRRGVTEVNEKGLYWEKIPGNLKQIDAGPTGVVWGVNRYNRIFCRIGIQKQVHPEGTGWIRVEGNMKYVSCGEYGCWAVNKRDNVYFRVGITEQNPQGNQWVVVPDQLRMVESGPGGVTVGLNDQSVLFVRAGVVPEKPEGDRWIKMNLKLAHVTVGDRGIIGVLPDGTVAIYSDLNSFISQMPTITPTTQSLGAISTNLPLITRTPTLPTTIVQPTLTPTPMMPSALPVLKNERPNLEDSLAALSNDQNAKEKLHITPEMAARILKLIERKGNQFEQHHIKAAANSNMRNETTEPELLHSKKEQTKATSENNTDTQPPPKLDGSSVLVAGKPVAIVDKPDTVKPVTAAETNPLVPVKPAEPAGHVHVTANPPTENVASTAPPTPAAAANVFVNINPTQKPTPNGQPTHHVPTHPHTHPTATPAHPSATPGHPTATPCHATAAPGHPIKPCTPTVAPSPPTAPHPSHALAPKPHPTVPRTHKKIVLPQQPTALPAYPQPKLPGRPAHPTSIHHLILTQPSPSRKPTYAAPHAVNVAGHPTIGAGDKMKVKVQSLLGKGRLGDANVAYVQPAPSVPVAPPVQAVAVPTQQPQTVAVAAAAAVPTVAMELTRSCCAIPDSVCPIPKDCIGYIECHGYRGNYKKCDGNQFFNPITNICDYPANVDCDAKASKAMELTGYYNIPPPPAPQSFAESVPPPPPFPPPPPPPSPPAVSPQFVEASSNLVPAPRDQSGKSHESSQPRVNTPHTEDDGVLREVWFGLGLSPLLTLLTNNPRFPTNPDEYIVLDKFEAPPNAGDGYGQRLSTYYKAPMTGEYTFYMSCDNECELWISPDTEEIHSNLILELKHGHYTSFRQWHKYPDEQTSRAIYLQQGEYYFIESFMKEGSGGDDLSIGVKLPNGQLELPISKNLYLVPGDVGSTGLRKPGQPVQVTLSQTAPLTADTSSSQTPAAQSATYIDNVPLQPDQMGPKPGQTAEQWISENNKRPDTSSALTNNENPAYSSVANNPESIPGAEMYMNHPDDPIAIEDNRARISVKRDKVIDANFSAIK